MTLLYSSRVLNFKIMKYVISLKKPMSCISFWNCRDLKPQNILLNLEAGLVKVADMGLGRVLRKKYGFYSEEVGLYLHSLF